MNSRAVRSSQLSRYSVALLATAASIYLRFLLNPLLGNDAPLLISIIAVALAAWYGGLGAGLLAIVLSAVGGIVLFLRPLGVHDALSPAYLVRLSLFFLTGVIITFLTEALRATALERRRAERVSRGQAAALARTLNALATAPELNTFLAQVLAAAAEQLQSPSASLWFLNDAGDCLVRHMACGAGETKADPASDRTQTPLSGEVPLWQQLLRTRRPLVVEDVDTDPRITMRAELQAAGVKSLLVVPLFQDDTPLGLISIESAERRRFGEEERELALALAQQATLAVQLTRLAEQRQDTAVLQERNRMAREIHDTLAQGLTGIVIQLEAAEDTLAEEPDSARSHIVRARDLARQSLAEARRSVMALRPRALEHSELPAAFTRHIEQMTSGTPLRPEFVVHGTPHSLPPEVESNLLRIGLEALTNALKHARAREIRIELLFEPGLVRLSVQDDGQGFNPGMGESRNGFGLTGMQERAERIGGQLAVTSRRGRGTEVAIVVPLVAGTIPARSAV